MYTPTVIHSKNIIRTCVLKLIALTVIPYRLISILKNSPTFVGLVGTVGIQHRSPVELTIICVLRNC